MGKHGWSRGGMKTVAAAGLAVLLLAPVVHAQGNPVPDSTEDSTFSAYGPPPSLEEAPAEHDAFSPNRPIAPAPWNRAVSANLSLGSMLINAVYFPVKMALGIVGIVITGFDALLYQRTLELEIFGNKLKSSDAQSPQTQAIVEAMKPPADGTAEAPKPPTEGEKK